MTIIYRQITKFLLNLQIMSYLITYLMDIISRQSCFYQCFLRHNNIPMKAFENIEKEVLTAFIKK
jgi:hypothetical protein